MVRYSKQEMGTFLKNKYPKKSFQEAMKILKDNYHVVVLNPNNSKKKAYLVCSSIINKPEGNE